MRIKTVSALLMLFFACVVLVNILCAADIITERTGTIKITAPDGTVLTVGKNETLPAIPSGSSVEILEGGAYFAPTEGFIQVIANGSVATVEAGSSVTVAVNSETGDVNFAAHSGKVNVITGNTTVTVNLGQEVRLRLDKATGVVEVESIKGLIETNTLGVKATVMQDAVAKISVDPKTRNVRVESVNGEVHVVSIDGRTLRVNQGESLETEGSAEGEIQTFGEGPEIVPIPEEEPVEPERYEASPHMP